MIQSNRTTTSSALLTGDYIISKVILNGGSAASSVILDDSTDGTGTKKMKIKALTNETIDIDIEKGLRFITGTYVTLAGAGAEVYVYFE